MRGIAVFIAAFFFHSSVAHAKPTYVEMFEINSQLIDDLAAEEFPQNELYRRELGRLTP